LPVLNIRQELEEELEEEEDDEPFLS